ncbi:hypothetical protein FJR48_02915 [Sulfurimonas lithotrophica]|uniref:Uncharacterized protein n=1 Tax=Sulfurimonas lithotrophica TaxID=2590022 RepID=A0A5P8NZ51_9BACT|nr:hypothetical protein [Sulfurimonas lithotrophica]QFR48725.1 hypothetical protein FJR48_02915 [Sulfurimonas lithotrophica]
MKNLFLILSILVSITIAEETPTRTGEFPKEQMKIQAKEIAQRAAYSMNEGLPQTIDKYTELISVKAENTTMVFTFEINTGAKSDEAVRKEDHSRMQKAVTVGVCQQSQKFLESGINTSYVYTSAKTKKLLFKFDISQDKCKGLVN